MPSIGLSIATPYFNPRAPCGARQHPHSLTSTPPEISIHAPLAGRDAPAKIPTTVCTDFNPRAPCGARRKVLLRRHKKTLFQSTRPLRGATGPLGPPALHNRISIHAPLAGRDEPNRPALHRGAISIHAPLAGRDQDSTRIEIPASISIHAPLAGRDLGYLGQLPAQRNFNPRAPCGARRQLGSPFRRLRHFNPRAPCGARRLSAKHPVLLSGFQSTRPLRGATVSMLLPPLDPPDFNPRAPCGARPALRTCRSALWHFNPRAPCGARRSRPTPTLRTPTISIHAPLAGRDCSSSLWRRVTLHFNPRAPCGARPLTVVIRLLS